MKNGKIGMGTCIFELDDPMRYQTLKIIIPNFAKYSFLLEDSSSTLR
jgi:hypothetical protein